MGLKAVSFVNINGALNTRNVTGSATLLPSDNIVYVNNTSGADVDITAPAAPADKQFLMVKDIAGNAGTHKITFIGTMDGVTNPSFQVDYGGFLCTYNGSSWSEHA
jgi:hypothetical protein